jgi:hypothetical protein
MALKGTFRPLPDVVRTFDEFPRSLSASRSAVE